MKTGLTTESTLADKLAWFLSTVLSPLFVAPIFTAFLVAGVTDTWNEFLGWYVPCVALSTGVPFAYIGWNVRRGHITDLHVRLLEQRTGPFLAGVVGLGLLELVLLALGAPSALSHMVAVAFVNAVLFAWISRSWKISVHTGSLSVCLAGGIVLLDWSPWCLMLLPPLIWARTARRRHHPAQGSLGAVIGLLLTIYPLRWLAQQAASLWDEAGLSLPL